MNHIMRVRSLPVVAGLLLVGLIPGVFGSIENRRPTQCGSKEKGDISLDRLLGGNGRAEHAAKLARQVYSGKTYSWGRYVDWGKELTRNARVKSPPIGAGPSPLLSKTYRCVHCHNFVREDLHLDKQDPEARETMIRGLKLDDAAKRDGLTLSLTPGTTLWGAVNRESFYNGYYSKYHRLRVRDGAPMNPKRLDDAVQVCCNYCSNGRFAESWELDSIVAYLWELEIRLKDLNLPEATRDRVLAAHSSGDNNRIANMREFLRAYYLRRANATLADCPTAPVEGGDRYEDGTVVKGDPAKGKFLYQSACAGCHGSVHPSSGARLANNFGRFHRFVLRGTVGDETYMPFFAKERLSCRQLADIRVYLRSIR